MQRRSLLPAFPVAVSLCLVGLSAGGCGYLGIGLSSEDADALAGYQSRAQFFWESQQLGQAMQQVVRGKEIDPDDYKLNYIEGWLYLRSYYINNREENLAKAIDKFDEVMDWRNPERQHPAALHGHAAAYQQLAYQERRESQRLSGAIERAGEGDAQVAGWMARRAEALSRSKAHLQTAQRSVQHLIDKGELLLESHKIAMELAQALRDYPACYRHGEAYLDLSQTAQEQRKLEIRETRIIGYEAEKRRELQALRGEEKYVREFLAEVYYLRERFQDCIQQLNLVLAMDPDRADGYFNRARCYERLGQTEPMKRDYRSFLVKSDLPEGNPKKAEAREALGRL